MLLVIGFGFAALPSNYLKGEPPRNAPFREKNLFSKENKIRRVKRGMMVCPKRPLAKANGNTEQRNVILFFTSLVRGARVYIRNVEPQYLAALETSNR